MTFVGREAPVYPPEEIQLVTPPASGSIAEWVEEHAILTKRVETGMVLHLQRMGLLVVPYEEAGRNGYNCVIVLGNQTYPQGGWDIFVSTAELERGLRIYPTVPEEES